MWEGNKEKEVVKAYVDGSYRNKKAAWAFVVIKDDNVIHEACGVINDEQVNLGHQIGGECQSVLKALQWAAEHNKQLIIYYDYIGLMKWVADIIRPRCKPWRTNKEYTVAYRKTCLVYRDYIKDFVKVKSHSGVKWNEYVDSLAEKAYG